MSLVNELTIVYYIASNCIASQRPKSHCIASFGIELLAPHRIVSNRIAWFYIGSHGFISYRIVSYDSL